MTLLQIEQTQIRQLLLLPDQGLLYVLINRNMIRYDPTLVDLLCTDINVYLYNYSKWVELSINIKITISNFASFSLIKRKACYPSVNMPWNHGGIPWNTAMEYSDGIF